MIKSADELKAQAALKGITFWPVHDCSICGYTCGYYLYLEKPYYDSGCNCVYSQNLDPRSWEDVAYTYNLNQPENNPQIRPEFLKTLNLTWQFPHLAGQIKPKETK